MAIDIQLNLQLAESQLKDLTQRLNNAVQNVSAPLEFITSKDSIKTARQEILAITRGLDIEDLGVAPGAIQAFERVLNKAVRVNVGSLTVKANALRELRKDIELADLEVTVKASERIEAERSGVSGQGLTPLTKELQRAIGEAAGLRAAEKKLAIQLDEETNAVARRNQANLAEFRESRKRIDSINKARESLESATLDNASALKSAIQKVRALEKSQALAAEAAIPRPGEKVGLRSQTPRLDVTPLPGGGTLGDELRKQEASALNSLKAEVAIREARKLALEKTAQENAEAARQALESAKLAKLRNSESQKVNEQLKRINSILADVRAEDISPENAAKKIGRIERTNVETPNLEPGDVENLSIIKRETIDAARAELASIQKSRDEEGARLALQKINTQTLSKLNDFQVKELIEAGSTRELQGALNSIVKLRLKTEEDLTSNTRNQLLAAQLALQSTIDEREATQRSVVQAEEAAKERRRVATEAGKEVSKLNDIQRALTEYESGVQSATDAIRQIERAARPISTPSLAAQGNSEEAAVGTNIEVQLQAAKEQEAAAAIDRIRRAESASQQEEAAAEANIRAEEERARQITRDLQARQSEATRRIRDAKFVSQAQELVRNGSVTLSGALKRLAQIRESEANQGSVLNLSDVGRQISDTLQRRLDVAEENLTAEAAQETELARQEALQRVNSNAIRRLGEIRATEADDARALLQQAKQIADIRIKATSDLSQTNIATLRAAEDELRSQAAVAQKTQELAAILDKVSSVAIRLEGNVLSGEKALAELGIIASENATVLDSVLKGVISGVERQALAAAEAASAARVNASLEADKADALLRSSSIVQKALQEEELAIANVKSAEKALNAVRSLRIRGQEDLTAADARELDFIEARVAGASKLEGLAKQEESSRAETIRNIKLLAENVRKNAEREAEAAVKQGEDDRAKAEKEAREKRALAIRELESQFQELRGISNQLRKGNDVTRSFFDKLSEAVTEADKLGNFGETNIVKRGLGRVGAEISNLASKVRIATGNVEDAFDLAGIKANLEAQTSVSAALRQALQDELTDRKILQRSLERNENNEALAARISARIVDSDRRIQSIRSNAEIAELERLKLLNQFNNAQRKNLSNAKSSASNAVTSSRQNRSGAGSDGGTGAVTFSTAEDVIRFSQRLDLNQLRQLSSIMSEVSKGTAGASQKLNEFARGIDKAGKNQKVTNKALNDGQNFAFDFGKQSALAARRLLAWAGPAQLIFTTISALKNAVSEIIKLDTATRRLIFFNTAGVTNTKAIADGFRDGASAAGELSSQARGLSAVSSATEALAARSRQLSQAQQQIFFAAKEQGLALGDVSEALIETARVGQDVTSSFDDAGKIATRSSSQFASAALALVRLEAGALSASDAVRGLNAIQAQFFSGRSGFSELRGELGGAAIAATQVASASQLLAVTSARSAASVSELIDATTRVGAAFKNVQGLNFDQTIALVGQSFNATGATTGRLSTALRQLSTLIAQNAEKIQEITGISVVNADGTLRDVNAIFDVLEKIRDSAGTLQATELSLLVADRRNIGDIQALAASVDDLRSGVEAFDSVEDRVAARVKAASEAFEQNKSLAESLEGRINSLKASFVELVASAGVQELVSGFVSIGEGALEASKVISEIGAAIQSLGPGIIKGGAVLAFTLLAGLAVSFGKGLSSAVSLVFNLTSAQAKAVAQLQAEESRIQGIQALRKKNLLTAKESEVFAKKSLAIQTKKKANEQASIANAKKEQSLRAKGNILTEKGAAVLSEKNALEKQTIALLKEEEALVTRISAKAKAAGALKSAGSFAARGGAAIAAAVSITNSDIIQKELQSVVGESWANGIQTVGVAAAIGTAIAGPLGGVLGAFIGALTAAFQSISDELNKSAEITKKFEQRGEARRSRRLAKEEIARIDEVFNRLNAKSKENATKSRAELVKVVAEIDKALTKTNRKDLFSNASDGAQFNNEIKTRLATTSQITDESLREANIIGTANERRGAAEVLLKRQLQIQNRLVKGGLTAAEVINLQNEQKSISEDLENKEVKALAEGKRLLEAQAIAKQKVLDVQRQITEQSRIEKALGDAILASSLSEKDKLTIKFQLDERQFEVAIKGIEKEIDALNNELKKSGLSEEKQNKIREKIQKKEDERNKKSFARLSAVINSQRDAANFITRAAETQAGAFQKAGSSVVSAFKRVVSLQAGLANIFKKIGEETGRILDDRAKSISQFLESSGASISSRLASLVQSSNLAIGNARSTASRRSGAISGGVFDAAGVRAEAARLVNLLGEVAARADEKIVSKRTGAVNVELAQLRQLATVENANFNLRIKNTRAEIGIRRDLLNTEINAIRSRIEEEKKLAAFRRDQQEQFGRLLIESPDKFKETIDDIAVATKFFRGITDVNIGGLRTLAQRVGRARAAGNTDLIAQVRRGIEASASFGRDDILGGVGNQRLQGIFERIQLNTPDSVARQEEERLKLANQQSDLQKDINERQRELVKLGELDVNLQRALITIANKNEEIARADRARSLTKLTKIADESTRQRIEVDRNLSAVVAVLTGQLTLQAAQAQLGGKQADNFAKALSSVLGVALPGLSKSRVDSPEGLRDSLARGRLFEEFAAEITKTQTRLDAVADEELRARRETAAVLKRENAARVEATKKLNDATAATNALTSAQAAKVAKDSGIAGLGPQGATKTAETIGKTIARFTSGGRGGFGIQSKELSDLNALRENGGQLNAQQQRRFDELNRQTRRQGLQVQTGGGRLRAARAALSSTDGKDIVDSFRQTLKNTDASGEFIDRARALRGSGSSGRRNIDEEATKKFLEAAGFAGAASLVTSKKAAAEQLDKFIELSERFAAEQGEISKKTQKELQKALADEFIPGVRKIFEDGAAAAKTAEEKKAEREARNESIRAAQSAKAFKDELRKSFSEGGNLFIPFQAAIEVGSKAAAAETGSVVGAAVTKALADAPVRKVEVDPVEVVQKIIVATNDALNIEEVKGIIRDAITPFVGDSQQIEDNTNLITEMFTKMQAKGLFTGVRRGRQEPLPPQ